MRLIIILLSMMLFNEFSTWSSSADLIPAKSVIPGRLSGEMDKLPAEQLQDTSCEHLKGTHLQIIGSIMEDEVKLYNDTLSIHIFIRKTDTAAFMQKFLHDSSHYSTSSYYRDIPWSIFRKYPFYPVKEIGLIRLTINDHQIDLLPEETAMLFNPAPESFKYGEPGYGIAASTDAAGNIYLMIECGEGAGAYRVYFLFDSSGKMVSRREVPFI